MQLVRPRSSTLELAEKLHAALQGDPGVFLGNEPAAEAAASAEAPAAISPAAAEVGIETPVQLGLVTLIRFCQIRQTLKVKSKNYGTICKIE